MDELNLFGKEVSCEVSKEDEMEHNLIKAVESETGVRGGEFSIEEGIPYIYIPFDPEYDEEKTEENMQLKRFEKNGRLYHRARIRIRKLTEREAFRLMDVDDADIDRIQATGLSRSAQYKMAGNSIVVAVEYHTFRKLFIDRSNDSQQRTLF